jgi:hypothetical protein
MRAVVLVFAVASLVALSGCECQSSPAVPGNDTGVDGSGTDGGRGGMDAAPRSDTGPMDAASTDLGIVYFPDSLFDTGDGCGLVTCASSHASCGFIGDGCGGRLFCGSCFAPETCGGAGIPSQCGNPAMADTGCVALSCAAQNVHCGPAGDGCGNMQDCGSCSTGQTCGGGGVASTCGTPSNTDAGCMARTCASQNIHCGPASDGCGNMLDCGGCTITGETCGGGGVPYQCGSSATVDAGCVASTCAAQNLHCGMTGDGCGHMLDCGGCTNPGDTCGGGGMAGVCGSPGCVPTRTTCPAGYNCDSVDDGCGHAISCGTCTVTGQTCGGGGTPFHCGSMTMPCIPRTCASTGATCGVVADGCGGLTPDCGPCTAPAICGGSGVPNQCGAGTDAGMPCMGTLCTSVNTCTPTTQTTITGIVTAPGHADTATWGNPDPLYGVHVYVPGNRGTLPAFSPSCTTANRTCPSGETCVIPSGATTGTCMGVSCDQCTAALPGNPIVSATTDAAGRYTLTGVPCGMNIPLIIQLGRWRRQVVIPNVACCQTTDLTTTATLRNLSRMPRTRAEGDIPAIAMLTGRVDALECVLRKIGIDDSEFSVPAAQGGDGRVRFYLEGDNGTRYGADIGSGAPGEAQLWQAGGDIGQYDMTFFACEGARLPEQTADQQRIINYANSGGRVFATHFSYVWLTNSPTADPTTTAPAPYAQTALWTVGQDTTQYDALQTVSIDTIVTGTASTPFTRGIAFEHWLVNVGATATLGSVSVGVVRHDFNAVNPPAQRWLYMPGRTDFPIHYTFDTPLAAPIGTTLPANQCGRVVFSDFHVEDTSGLGAAGSTGYVFPGECTNGPLTAQERVLEFMLFDLASCIQPPTCTPQTCAQQNLHCGPAGDGCGGTIMGGCGMCTTPGDTCGGGGTAGVCGHPNPCVPLTCSSPGVACGPGGDGCGGTLNCPCPTGQTCGGGGVAGQCGTPPVCMGLTCAQQNLHCGPAGDGCGRTLDCGPCTTPGDTCGGGGVVGMCGHGMTCNPLTCTSPGVGCGPQGNGCGGMLNCTCPAGTTCGGGGVAGTCGTPGCPPRTCAMTGGCGIQSDGCGSTITCPCPTGQTCGGGGVANMCGTPMCPPRTCASIPTTNGPACGVIADGCGGSVDCGMCTPPATCGGGGHANECGTVG